MATTEEMNPVQKLQQKYEEDKAIAIYDGWAVSIAHKQPTGNPEKFWLHDSYSTHLTKTIVIASTIEQIGRKYRFDWNFLLSVWGKLQKNINNSLYNEYGKCLDKNFEKTVFEELKDSIIHVDITEAHRLIYEAITWLNKNKGK